MAYWLYEVARRSLHEKRGFASIGDYARELIEIQPRKAQYLVYIASRLEKLPRIAESFDSGKLSWTKAREIVRVATPETEVEWLHRAKGFTSRELEKEVRRLEGRGSGEFATLTISLPIELLPMWNDCYELAERLSVSDLEKWQVLEPMMAEFLGTFLPAEHETGPSPHETGEEKEASPEDRRAVLERDGYRCVVPGCSMRKMLDVHHVSFRSQGGGDELSNLATICRPHHSLIHKGKCSLRGTPPHDLKFERPAFFTEKKARLVENMTPPVSESIEEPRLEPEADASESWRDEVVAEIFDAPLSSTARTAPRKPFGDLMLEWVGETVARERHERAALRRKSVEQRIHRESDLGEHVFGDCGFLRIGDRKEARTGTADGSAPVAARDSSDEHVFVAKLETVR